MGLIYEHTQVQVFPCVAGGDCRAGRYLVCSVEMFSLVSLLYLCGVLLAFRIIYEQINQETIKNFSFLVSHSLVQNTSGGGCAGAGVFRQHGIRLGYIKNHTTLTRSG